jgi:hypothetical protein
MSNIVKAEFYALYEFKKVVERAAQTAYAIEKHAASLVLPTTAFTHVENSKKVHRAWKMVCKDRKEEAAELRAELNAVVTALGSVIQLYGWTDAELAKAVARAGKLR